MLTWKGEFIILISFHKFTPIKMCEYSSLWGRKILNELTEVYSFKLKKTQTNCNSSLTPVIKEIKYEASDQPILISGIY